MRKDVECTFGILKGCWRILKTGIRVHNTEVGDNIWLTCCALQNMLLDVDGLNKAWRNEVRSHWEMESGEFRGEEIPFAVRRLVDPTCTEEFRLRHYDASRFEYQRPPIVVSNNEEDNNAVNQNCNCRSNRISNNTTSACRIQSGTAVNKLNFFRFRSLLIENFNIRSHEKNLQWPKRLARASPRNVPAVTIAV